MKISKLLYTIIFSLLILSYFRLNTLAHESINIGFLFLNSEKLQLLENLNPKTYKLEYYAHVAENALELNKQYILKADISILKEYFGVEDIEIVWEYENNKVENTELVLNYANSKGVIFNFTVYSDGEKFFAENFLLNFGKKDLGELNFSVNGINSSNKIINVTDHTISLEVTNPKIGKKYLWEVDSVLTQDQTKFEYTVPTTSIFPIYVTLRELDLESMQFIDSYVKLELSKPELYKINTPAVLNNDTVINNNSSVKFSLVGLAIVVPLLIIILYLKKIKKI